MALLFQTYIVLKESMKVTLLLLSIEEAAMQVVSAGVDIDLGAMHL